jgi:DNA-binding transcriptional MerR regulator
MTGWSTRQLADLAGTTLRAVRHYHDIGLLPPPARGANGYKQYGAQHLVQLIKIRRLTELGVPLSQLGALSDSHEKTREILRIVDDELTRSIDKQLRIKAELTAVLQQDLPVDLPAELAVAAHGLAAPTRALMVVYGQVLDQQGRDALRRFLEQAGNTAVDSELDQLSPNADAPTRQNLADRLLPRLQALLQTHRQLLTTELITPERAPAVRHTIALAIAELYNPAQLDVITTVSQRLAQAELAPAPRPIVLQQDSD